MLLFLFGSQAMTPSTLSTLCIHGDARLTTFNIDSDSSKENIFELIETLQTSYSIEAKLTDYKTRDGKIIILGMTFEDLNNRSTNMQVSTSDGIPELCIIIDDLKNIVSFAGSCENQDRSILTRDPEFEEKRQAALYARLEQMKERKKLKEEALVQRKNNLEKAQSESELRQKTDIDRKREQLESQGKELRAQSEERRLQAQSKREEFKKRRDSLRKTRQTISIDRKTESEKRLQSRKQLRDSIFKMKKAEYEARKRKLQNKTVSDKAYDSKEQLSLLRDSISQAREILMEQKREESRARIKAEKENRAAQLEAKKAGYEAIKTTLKLTTKNTKENAQKPVTKIVKQAPVYNSAKLSTNKTVPELTNPSIEKQDQANINETIQNIKNGKSSGKLTSDSYKAETVFFSGEQCTYKVYENRTFVYDKNQNTLLVINTPLGDHPARGKTTLKGVTYDFEYDGLSLTVKNRDGMLLNRDGNLLNPLASFEPKKLDASFQMTKEFLITSQSTALEIRNVIQEMNSRGFEFLILENVHNSSGAINYFAFKINGKAYNFREYEGIPVLSIQIDEPHKKARVQTAY